MKKIMFNEPYGLNETVLEGRKTMTRRIVTVGTLTKAKAMSQTHGKRDELYIRYYAYYKVGDVVAISQRYSGLFPKEVLYDCENVLNIKYGKFVKGWNNKMYVNAELMPHHIRITNVKVEHLQDISDDDCMKEGVVCSHGGYGVVFNGNYHIFAETPREAFAYLIDKTSGKGTWERNPLVYVYSFELVD